MGEDLSLSEKLDKIAEQLEETKADKKFKLPWSARLSKGKLLKKEFCIVLFIRSNRSAQIKVLPIEDDTVMFQEKIFDARAGNILNYKKMPMLVIKEWDMLPLAPEEDYEKAVTGGRLTAAQKLILTKMKMEAIKPKMQLNFKVILIILVILGAGYYFLNSSGMA